MSSRWRVNFALKDQEVFKVGRAIGKGKVDPVAGD